MRQLTLVLVALCLSISNVFSQPYSFKVLVMKGKSEVRSGSSWQPLKTGSSLNKNDEIRLQENAYLGLVSHEGKPTEVKKSGVHKVSDLLSQLNTGTTVMTKYTDFILSSNNQSKNTLKATGAVTRGTNFITVYLPTVSSYTLVYGNTIIIDWERAALKGPFTVLLSNAFGDDLRKIETADDEVTLNLDDRDFLHEDNIKIKIVSKADNKASEDQLMIRRLSKADRERIRKQLEELNALASEETALNQYYLAGFFESNNLLIDASTAYQRAIKLAPEVAEYKELYQAFLLRTGLKEPKEKK